jgi:hypothetical protein
MSLAEWAIFGVGAVAAVAAVLGARWARKAAWNTDRWQTRQSRPIPVITIRQFPATRAGIYNAGGSAQDCFAILQAGRHIYLFRGPVPANLHPVQAQLTWAGPARVKGTARTLLAVAIDSLNVWWDCLDGVELPRDHATWINERLARLGLAELIRAEAVGDGVRLHPLYVPSAADRIRFTVMAAIIFDTPRVVS